MTLLFIDGFDHYAAADGTKKWNVFGTGVSINSSGGRRSSGCLSFSGNTRFADKALPGSYSTLIVGFALDTGAGNTSDIMCFLDGATIQTGLFLTANNAISAFRATNGTVLGTSANNTVPASGFCYIEVKCTFHDSAGTVDVRVNGVSVLSLSSQDTRNGGNASATGFRLRGIGAPTKYDDLYVCDASGAANNNFLGDVRVDALYPTSDGTNSAWTPSTGTTHYTLVDETAPNTADYVESSTAAQKDTYGFGDISHTPVSIFGAQVNIAALKDDAGARSVKVVTRSGGADYSGTSLALGTSLLYYNEVRETDPATGAAWTTTNLNAAEFGVECV